MYVLSPGVAELTTNLPSSNLNFSPVSFQMVFSMYLSITRRNSLPPSMMHCVDVRVPKQSHYEMLSTD